MPDRVVKVTLLAQVGQYVSELQRSQQATQKLASETDKMSKAEKIAAQDAAKSAAIHKQSMETVAKVAIGVGGAITAVGIAALKTGIQYNTLQQTTRAALTTLLGSAKAANDQMDKLDAFARKSPFAKQIFITAQQQLIGFGMAAEKVLPTLDAIQNAVAATGGSSQQLSEVAFVIAQIQAAGKITATDLMQLGQRGIDAATIIGSQMGKTGAQIRQDITAGALSAGDALDALTAGMQERFGGAADNVKKTFAGAMDRVKGAWRDFSSVLAEPLVGKHGGGALIGLLNWTADLMRAFIALPDPIKLTASAGVGLIGVVSLLGGTAVLALPKIVAFRVAIETLKTESPFAARAIGGLSTSIKLLGGAAVAGVAITSIFSLADAMKDRLRPEAEELSNALATATTAKDLFDRTIVKRKMDGSGMEPLIKSAKDLHDVLAMADTEATGFFGWLNANTNFDLNPVKDNLKDFREQFQKLGKDMAAAPDTIAPAMQKIRDEFHLSSGEIERLIKFSPELTAALTQQATDLKIPATSANLLKLALGNIAPATKDVASAQDVAAKSAAGYSAALDGVSDGTEDAAKAQGKWIQAVAEADASFVDLKGAYDSVVEKNKALAQSTADATKSSKDSWETYYDGVKVKISDFLKDLEKQVTAQTNWESNMLKLAGKVSAGTLSELAKMGPEGAPLVAQLVNASSDELSKMDGLFKQKAGQATGAFATTLDQAQPVIQAAASQLGKKGAEKVIAELAKGSLSVEDVIKKYNIKLEQQRLFIWADTSRASSAVDTFIKQQNHRTITLRVQANGITTLQNSISKMVAFTGATGGYVPGAPSRTDNTLAYVASGEHITRTEQAQKPGNRRMLEWINAGGNLPSYAGGGFVQPVYADSRRYAQPSVTAPAAAPTFNMPIYTSLSDPAAAGRVAADELAFRWRRSR